MAHIVSGSIEFGHSGVTMRDCVVIGTGRGYAMEFSGFDGGHIGSFSVRYAAKPLHERFADFKDRLRAAMDRHGL